MSTTIEFTWDSRDLQVWRGPSKVWWAVAVAMTRAGGDAARAMKAEASRGVRSKKRMKVAMVNKSLPLTFPTSKEISRLAWRMDVSGALVPVYALPHRQTRKGVTVEINVGKRTLIKGAFLATMKSGHRGVFMRTGEFGRRGNPKLEKIKEAFTTKVSDVFRDAGFIPAVQAKAQARFTSAFARLLPMELDKLKNKGGT
jgi:hypothetical protein